MIASIIKSQNNFVPNMSFRVIILSMAVILIAGQFLNFFVPHRLFDVNQLILCFMLASQIFVIKKLDKECRRIKESILKSRNLEVSSLFSIKAAAITNSKFSFFAAVIFVVFYIGTMFVLGSVETTITGIYGALLGALVFYTGIMAYVKYISLSYFAYDLKNVDVTNYFFYYPSLTDWIKKLATLFSFIEKWFLVLGVLYTTLFAINLPPNTINFYDGLILNSNNDFLLIITWIGILFFFVLAFPALTFFSHGCIKSKITMLKNITIQEIEKRISSLHDGSADNLDSIGKYLNLIKAVDETANYPLKSVRAIFDGIYSMLMALAALVSPLLPLIENII